MAVGDVTKLPTAGIQLDGKVADVSGNSTTVYIAMTDGRVYSITTSGATLTLLARIAAEIVSIVYTGVSGYEIVVVTKAGKVYGMDTDGSDVTKVADLNMGMCGGAYYASNLVYLFPDNMQQEASSMLKVALA
jgi:hypothetical protein